ncbi:MAG: BamA/TamA family outer membrane protein [Bacteroidetes bacterium]|nr:BamA/TamA family outer membrane protein [Bacteroidota bacterium]
MQRIPAMILLLMLLAGKLRAQNYFVQVQRMDGSDSSLISLLKTPKDFSSETAALDYLRHVPTDLQEAGFLAASIDSFWITENHFHAQLFVGKKWHWARLSLKKLPPGLLINAGISEAEYSDQALNPKNLSSLTRRVLEWCDNHGYPFAQTGLDSISENGAGEISGNFQLELGPLCKIDSIIIEGDERLSKHFLLRYLDLNEGSLYDESRLRKINNRLRELPFLDAGTTSRVQFKLGGTQLHILLKERKANQLSGIVGLQPNNSETGKLLLTVDAQAAFQNLLAKGESFSFSFQNLQPKSPRIKASATYPYILGTAIGADGNFDLYFRNTEYRRSNLELGARYSIHAMDYLRVYFSSNSNRIITPDTAYVLAYHRLPDNIDLRSTGGGFELAFNRTDYNPNPSKGWSLSGSIAALQREVLKNDGITRIQDGSGFDFGKLYDTVGSDNKQIQVRAALAGYVPLVNRIVLKTVYSGGWMSGERLFQNELFQLGGFRLLRGFDEGSLFANQYHIATLELRLLLGLNSTIYAFSDNAWLQSKINGILSEGFYYGLGLGSSMETKSGIFSIACGIGKNPGNGFQWREAKIHVGYAAYF